MRRPGRWSDRQPRQATVWRRATPSLALLTVVAVLLIAALLTTALLLTVGGAVVAADPTPSAVPVLGAVDSRSDGGGPGLVGSPVLVALGVVVLGLVTALATLAIARFTRRA